MPSVGPPPRISEDHRQRLDRFERYAGQVVPLPSPTRDGLFLVTRAKGIYKPADLEYALSVRVMISSPYADKAVERHPGGGWTLDYFQENTDPASVRGPYTNRGLLACSRDQVPVGVLVQRTAKPARY